jgi:hypothetical protein
MKTFPWILFLLAVAAALVLYAWGDRQAQSARECRIALLDLHRAFADGELPPPDASPETVARLVSRLAAERTAAVERSVAPLHELPARFEALRTRAETAEAALAKASDARAEAVAAARAEERALAAEDLEAARAETDSARAEFEDAQRALASLQTRFDDAQATLAALMQASSGDVIDVADDPPIELESTTTTKSSAKKNRKSKTPVAPPAETPTPPDALPEPAADAPSADSDLPEPEPAEPAEPEPTESTEEIVAALNIPETPESHDDSTDSPAPVAPPPAIGRSTRFLTFTYSPSAETLDVQLLDGTLLQYAPVPQKTAEKLRTAGNRLDDRFNSLVRNRIPCSADEKAAFKALRSARLPAETALWTETD